MITELRIQGFKTLRQLTTIATHSPEFPNGMEQFSIGPPLNKSISRAPSGMFGGIGTALGMGLPYLIRHESESPIERAIYDFLLGIRVVDLSPKMLRAPAGIRRDAQLERDGAGLAAVLDNLAGEQPALRDRIDEEVRRAASEVARVVTLADRKQEGSKVLGVAERSGQVFSADYVSDGLLLFIALSTAIQMSGGKTLIGLEELEKGIHPRRIRGLVDQLLRMSREGSQVVLTTHSPTLLDEFRDFPERVLICEREGDDTKVTRLVDKPDWEESLKQSSLGEIWYSGILGGVPAR